MTSGKKIQPFRRRTPVQTRSRATVEAILEASARILRREGLASLNTNRIAKLAGVSIGTLYGYFPDKSAILVALAREFFERDEQALISALADITVSPTRALVRALLHCHSNDRSLRRTVMGHHIGLGLGHEHAEHAELGGRKVAERLLARGLPEPNPVQYYVLTYAVLGVCRSLVDGSGNTPPPAINEIEDELVALVDVYLSGLSARRVPGPRKRKRVRS